MKQTGTQPPSTAGKIKQAAVVMFAESGYEGTSLSEIAKAVGIKTPSIYAHFKSKETLFMQLLEEGIAEEKAAFYTLFHESKHKGTLERFHEVFNFFTSFTQLSAGQSFLKRSMLVPPRHLRDQLRMSFMAYETEINERMESLFEQGKNEGEFAASQDVRRMIAQFYNAIDGLLLEFQIYAYEVFAERKQIIRESLLRMWTATAT
ncbi:TetR/AcrR family transcriptional regulator [Paenibacillus sp. NEAU-GSW1]|uniref:TetR/AcrR family transcriptional regulator n=1 Tax=Paenibacillus sp. NEAU-GSW1 TaxID=2682486 RepID=UPI0012E12E5F|nr:TetR/AcrR family transcriptional regulator [Paenibacillus sp. NEAU-GSW1]MUT65119.1 TetR family transcriptional regulator [Paenibacillus sp. NEAU-GSW1]